MFKTRQEKKYAKQNETKQMQGKTRSINANHGQKYKQDVLLPYKKHKETEGKHKYKYPDESVDGNGGMKYS